MKAKNRSRLLDALATVTGEYHDRLDEIKRLRDAYKKLASREPGEYTIGMHNGVELVLAKIENRNPEFIYPPALPALEERDFS